MATFPILQCPKCLKTVDAKCHCGVPYIYIPAGKAAAKAVKEHPDLSNRAIGDKIGVSYQTIRRVRKTTDTNVSVDKRRGLDGKVRRMPQKNSSYEETVQPKQSTDAPKFSKKDERLIEKEVARRVEIEVAKRILGYETKTLYPAVWRYYKQAKEIISHTRGRGPFTEQEFKELLSVLHPDSRLAASNEKLERLFRRVNDVRHLLVRKDDRRIAKPTDLPSSVEEMRARFEEVRKR